MDTTTTTSFDQLQALQAGVKALCAALEVVHLDALFIDVLQNTVDLLGPDPLEDFTRDGYEELAVAWWTEISDSLRSEIDAVGLLPDGTAPSGWEHPDGEDY